MAKNNNNIQKSIPQKTDEKPKNKQPFTRKRLLTILAAAIILAATFAVMALGITTKFQFGDTPEKAVKRYYNALVDMNYEAYKQAMFGDRAEKDSKDYTDKNKYMQDYMAAIYENFGEDAKISAKKFKVFYEDIPDNTYRGEDLKTLNVSEVATVTCDLTIKGSLNTQSQTVDVICFKSDGNWYIYGMAEKRDMTQQEIPLDTSNVYGAPTEQSETSSK